MPVRSGRGSVASTSSRSHPRRTRRAPRSGRESAPKTSVAAVRGHLHRERLGEVGHLVEGEPERPDLGRRRRLVLLELERRSRSAPRCRRRRRSGGRSRARRAARSAAAARDCRCPARRHRHGLLARRVGERVGVRDEVEEVVGVQVREHHRVDVHVVDELAQLARRRRCRSRAGPSFRRPGAGSPNRPRRRPARRATCPGPSVAFAITLPRRNLAATALQQLAPLRLFGCGKAYAARSRSVRKTNASWRSGARSRSAGRKVVQGSSRSSAQSLFWLEVAVLTGHALALALRHPPPLVCSSSPRGIAAPSQPARARPVPANP